MPPRRIVIVTGHTWPDLSIEERVLARDEVRLVDGRQLSADDRVWEEAEGVLLGTASRMDRDRLQAMPRCRAVARYGIGYDNVDLAAAEELGIVVSIERDYCIEEVAEHAVTSALALARAIPHWDRNVRSGAWRSGPKPPVHRLSALALGIVGFGLIGRAAAEKARGLFGKVLVHDPVASFTDADRERGYVIVDTLDDMLAEADILTVHVPLVEGTRGLIGVDALKRMKPSAYVINVSLGGIIDEKALLEAIAAGEIAGAALDTFEKEPLPPDDPLLSNPKILLSPHVAWLSSEAEVSLREGASASLSAVLNGRLPKAHVSHRNTRLSG